MLDGAALGAPIGGLGKAAELGLARAKGTIDAALEKRALSKAKTPQEAIESGDLQHVDKRILDTAEKAEIERIRAEQAPQRRALTDDLDAWRRGNRDEHDLREIAKGSADPDLREAGGAFDRANLELRKALDNKIKFQNDPAKSLEAVQRQAQALDEMKAAALEQQRAWQQELADAPAQIRSALDEVSSLGERARAAAAGPELPESLSAAVEDFGPTAKELKLNSPKCADGMCDQIEQRFRESRPNLDLSSHRLNIISKDGLEEVKRLYGLSDKQVAALRAKYARRIEEALEDGGTRAEVEEEYYHQVSVTPDGIAIDWTANQFGKKLPVPYVYRLSGASGEVPSAAEVLAAQKKLASKLGLYDEVGPFTEAGKEAAADRVLKTRMELRWSGDDGAIKGGLKEPAIVRRLAKIDERIAANQRLQSQLEALAKPPTSDLLTKIADARAVIEGPKPAPSPLGAAVSAVAPFAGPVGAAAAAGGRVIGSFKKLAAAAGERVAKAASAFAGGAQKVAKVVAPVAPILATKVLAAVRYAGGENGKRTPAGGTTLPDLFDARAQEVREQIQVGPDGSHQMRPEARAKMAATFDGIRTADPVLADQLEEIGARRVEHLGAILPRQPDYTAMHPGAPARISDLAMRSWARSAAALEDPHAVFERAARGHVTLEDAAAIRAVYPELLGHFLSQVGNARAERKAPLPFRQALALSILTGEAQDPALEPAVLSVLQGSFTNDEGAPTTQAPTAMPAFGSVKRSVPEPTPSQRRAQGAT
ncbi:MAG TPA: hypothetical protein VJU58_10080 [Microbacterium sp.]|nr:hypothetical protein [Microbacterium sp.]